ncbi:MAG: M50 family metallopeptidase [Chloroflexales bacterium]
MLTTVLSIGAFLLMLGLLVVVHELGHFLSAIWLGIKVEEFGVGYPPRALVLFERGGVKYTLNWLPLGGFVRFASSGDGQDSLYGAGGSLSAASPWRKILVMVAGPLMNLLLAMFILAVIFMFQGVPTPSGGQDVGDIYAGTPAAAAGFQKGDELIRLDGQAMTNSALIPATARASQGRTLDAVVLRDGKEIRLKVTPGPWTAPDGTSYALGFGFSYSQKIVHVRANPVEAVWRGVSDSLILTSQMLKSLASLPASVMGIFASTPSGTGQPIGPVGIARATGEVIQQPGGLLAFWNLTAILSLNLFLLNLLPIPALDGSHIIFAIIEWLRGGKKVPPEKEAIVHAFGFVALMALMLLITVNDVINAIHGTPVLGN